VLAQEAVPDKANELAAIPPLLERLGAEEGLKGALVAIDAVATNAEVARAIAAQGADWLLAVKANQPTSAPRSRPPSSRRATGLRRTPTSTRATAASRSAAPSCATPAGSKAHAASRALSAADAATAIRGHWAIESAPQAHARRRFMMMN